MPSSEFVCPTPKCGYAIASEGMNAIQLKALRMWAKTCPKCGKISHWTEKLPLLNGDQIKTLNGGQKDASTSKTVPKTAGQKRRATRHTGH